MYVYTWSHCSLPPNLDGNSVCTPKRKVSLVINLVGLVSWNGVSHSCADQPAVNLVKKLLVYFTSQTLIFTNSHKFQFNKNLYKFLYKPPTCTCNVILLNSIFFQANCKLHIYNIARKEQCVKWHKEINKLTRNFEYILNCTTFYCQNTIWYYIHSDHSLYRTLFSHHIFQMYQFPSVHIFTQYINNLFHCLLHDLHQIHTIASCLHKCKIRLPQ